MIARVTLLGNVGRVPEAKQTRGKELATFSLATSAPVKAQDGTDEYKTTWWEIVTFGSLASHVLKKGEKGGKAFVEGRFEKNEYVAKDGTTKTALRVIADTVTFIHEKGTDNGGNFEGTAKKTQITQETANDDDIPF